MKKMYSKPEIVFESFVLSTNIAGNCKTIINTPSYGNCAYSVTDEFLGPLNIFVTGVSACTTTEADGEYNGICYQTPVDTSSLFNS